MRRIRRRKDKGEREPAVYRRKVRCPRCGSRNTYAYCTLSPVQYRKCRRCGERFKQIALNV